MAPVRQSVLFALLLALGGVLAPAQVVITPHSSVLLAGQVCAFQLRLNQVQAPGAILPAQAREDWTWRILEGGPGSLDEATGVYAAPPEVAEPCLVKVEATYLPLPELSAQALVLVLPAEPFSLVGQVLGREWVEPFSSAMPFWHPSTGRPVDGARVHTQSWQPPAQFCHTYGLPFVLRWQMQLEAEGQRLTYKDGQETICRDVTGQTSQEITASGKLRDVRMEALHETPGQFYRWFSNVQTFSGSFTGVVPWAGHGLAEPGHADGSNLQARFAEPFGLALVTEGEYGCEGEGCLVTDPTSHVIRRIFRGRVSTPWGKPGQAGHLDAEPTRFRRWATALGFGSCLRAQQQGTLFNGPTFLCVWPGNYLLSGSLWRCLVADSGNHVIRALHQDGPVTTLAGTPGQAGHRDGWTGRGALFNNPQGLAEDPQGNCYVADQGNHVIRRMTHWGEVETVAGSPGEAGSTDGIGAQARFRALRGLAFLSAGSGPPGLYAVDGHAIRRIRLPGYEVTTVLGVVDVPGFRDVVGDGGPEARRQALQAPCLNEPCGIMPCSDGLIIADTGNHCLRKWAPASAFLVTQVGDPGEGRTRSGLVRDGLGTVDDRFATLASPRTLLFCPDQRDALLVTTGSCLAAYYGGSRNQDDLLEPDVDCSPATLGEPCRVRFSVEALSPEGVPAYRTIHYSVDFLEPDGTLAERREGTGTTASPITVQGQFGQRGTGTVAVRCVTDQGAASGAQWAVEIF